MHWQPRFCSAPSFLRQAAKFSLQLDSWAETMFHGFWGESSKFGHFRCLTDVLFRSLNDFSCRKKKLSASCSAVDCAKFGESYTVLLSGMRWPQCDWVTRSERRTYIEALREATSRLIVAVSLATPNITQKQPFIWPGVLHALSRVRKWSKSRMDELVCK